MRYRPRIVGKGTLLRRGRGTRCTFGIELEGNDVREIIFLYRRADLKADFGRRATQELAIDQAAVFLFQRVGPGNGRRQSQRSNESPSQREPHHDFLPDAPPCFPGRYQL